MRGGGTGLLVTCQMPCSPEILPVDKSGGVIMKGQCSVPFPGKGGWDFRIPFLSILPTSLYLSLCFIDTDPHGTS